MIRKNRVVRNTERRSEKLFGRYFNMYMQKYKISDPQFAKKTTLSSEYVRKLRKGRESVPNKRVRKELCKGFESNGVKVDSSCVDMMMNCAHWL